VRFGADIYFDDSSDEEPWKILDITSMDLRTLCVNIGLYDQLTELYLQKNKLRILPVEIFNLKKLQILNLQHNQFTTIQSEISNLIELMHLDISWNQIRVLPYEMGKLFKLTSLEIDGNPIIKPHHEIIQKGTESIIGYLRDHMRTGKRPPERLWIKNEEPTSRHGYKSECLTIMCYNILADIYTTVEKYYYCPRWALPWDYRKNRLLKEMIGYKPDVICLQETQANHYGNFFRPQMLLKGYYGKFHPKSRARTMNLEDSLNVDGCAIFYKKDQFEEVDYTVIEFQGLCLQKHEEVGNGIDRLMARDNIAIALRLRPIGKFKLSSDKDILIVTTHIHWDPLYIDVKLMQVNLLIGELERLSENGEIPILLCGDFNSTNTSAAYQLLNTGSVQPDHPDFLGYNYGQYTETGLSHSLNFSSAYNTVTGEPPFTNYTGDFSGVLDYIWYTEKYLCADSILAVPEEEDIKAQNGALPNPWMCSDHVPVLFKVRERFDTEDF
jgi:CCR4-NOT transcription complex subunit 6